MAQGVSAITWSRVSDAVGPIEAAARRLAERHVDLTDQTARSTFILHPVLQSTPACLGKLQSRAAYTSVDDLDLVAVLRRNRQEYDSASAQGLAIDDLMSLPSPLLGALDGCVRASLAAALCDAWVAGRMRRAIAGARPALARAAAEHASFVERLACRIVDSRPTG